MERNKQAQVDEPQYGVWPMKAPAFERTLGAFDILTTVVISTCLLHFALFRGFSRSILGLPTTGAFIERISILIACLWVLKLIPIFRDLSHTHGGYLRWLSALLLAPFIPATFQRALLSSTSSRRALGGIAGIGLVLLSCLSILSVRASLELGLKASSFDSLNSLDVPTSSWVEQTFDLEELQERYKTMRWRGSGIAWEGWITAPQDGTYRFNVQAYGRRELAIDGRSESAVSLADPHGFDESPTDVQLTKGPHAILIRYRELRRSPFFQFRWTPPGGRESAVPAAMLFLRKPTGLDQFLCQSRLAFVLNIIGGICLTAIFCINFGAAIHWLREKAIVRRFHEYIGHEPNAIMLLVLTGFVSRLLMSLAMVSILWPDSFVYYQQALALVREHDFARLNRGPLYSMVLAAFMAFGASSKVGFLFIVFQRILGVLSTIFFYKVARRIFSPVVAFYSSVLFSLHTLLLNYETVVQTETLFVFLLSLLLYAFVRVLEQDSWRRYVFAGFLCGLLALTRPVGQLLVLLAPALVLLQFRSIKKTVLAAVMVMAAYLAVVGPWMYYEHRTVGFWGISLQRGLTMWFRVFDLDRLPPPEVTRHPAAKAAYDRAHAEHATTYYMVRGLLEESGLSPVEVDKEMFAFGLEGAMAHPGLYLANRVRTFCQIFVNPHDSVYLADSPNGPYLRTARARNDFSAAFPTSPPQSFRWLRECLALFFQYGYVRMGIVMAFFLVGVAAYFTDATRPRVFGLMLIASIFYFTATATSFNAPEDRYRLPIDALLFMFSAYGIARLGDVDLFGRAQPPA